MTSATALGRLAAIAVLALVAVGCGSPSVTAAPGESLGTGVPAPSGAACVIETPPGPDEQVPDPGEIDTTDLGIGRWRLCLVEPVAFSVEGTAWCGWTEDRAAVREAMGLPLPIGAEGSTVDGGIMVDKGVVYLASNEPRMISSWQGGPDDVAVTAQPNGTSGAAAFRIPATVDQDNPPAVRPPSAAGVITWLCADPPPPAS